MNRYVHLLYLLLIGVWHWLICFYIWYRVTLYINKPLHIYNPLYINQSTYWHSPRVDLGHSESIFVVEGARGSLRGEQKRTVGGGQAYLYVYSVKKIVKFFKELSLTRCLVFAKCFAALRLAQHKQVLFYQKSVSIFFSINDFDYLCNNVDLSCWYYKKINYFPAFHSPIFHSKIYNCCTTFFEKREGRGRELVTGSISLKQT